jgi:hypothetical protein
MSYHTVYPSWDCSAVPSYVHQQLHSLDWQNVVLYNSLVFLPISGPLMVQGFIFEGALLFSKLFKKTICKGVCTLKCTEKRFIPFTPLQSLP